MIASGVRPCHRLRAERVIGLFGVESLFGPVVRIVPRMVNSIPLNHDSLQLGRFRLDSRVKPRPESAGILPSPAADVAAFDHHVLDLAQFDPILPGAFQHQAANDDAGRLNIDTTGVFVGHVDRGGFARSHRVEHVGSGLAALLNDQRF